MGRRYRNNILQGYGLTETAPIAALTPEYQTKVGSAGKQFLKEKYVLKIQMKMVKEKY